MKKIIITSIVCVLFTSLGFMTGCNTVSGIGKDVAKGGKDIQRAAS